MVYEDVSYKFIHYLDLGVGLQNDLPRLVQIRYLWQGTAELNRHSLTDGLKLGANGNTYSVRGDVALLDRTPRPA